MRRILAPTAIAIALLLTVPAEVSADIYRWVDDGGTVHYSQNPPPDRDAETVDAARPPADDPEQRRAATEKLREANKVHLYKERLEREADTREKQRQEDLQAFCSRLREKRQKLANSPKVREKTEDGYRVMSYAERQQKLAVFDRRLGKRCSGG